MTSQPLYAIPAENLINACLIPGKRYQVIEHEDGEWYRSHGFVFTVIDEDGDSTRMLERDCAFGGSWTFVQAAEATAVADDNLEPFPYRVMYSCTTKLQDGGERMSHRVEHIGIDNRDEAIMISQRLRDLASQGKGLHLGQVIHASWIEFIDRTRLEA